MITDLKQSFKNAPEAVRNELAKQFEPLINKIVKQQQAKLHTDWNSLKSMAYEGLVQAMNTYEPGKVARDSLALKSKKDMDFKQYAAYMILNNIRNCSVQELNIVKLNHYALNNMKSEEVSSFVTVPLTNTIRDDDSDKDSTKSLMNMGLYESAKFSDGDVFQTLKTYIDANMKPADAKAFYEFFGICGYKEKQVREIAKELNVSSGRVSQRIKTVVNYIKSEPILWETLASLTSK